VSARAEIRLAVVTGGHPFDVIGFHDLLRQVGGERIVPYVQHLEDLASAAPETLRGYDAVLFYFFPMGAPVDDGQTWHAGRPRAAIESLIAMGTGLVVLHHALLAYPGWELWDRVVGCSGRDRFTFHPGRAFRVSVAEPAHEITTGIVPWTMSDETYCMPEPEGAPLLRVEHPDSMPTIAWARRCGASRVVCLQSGHDALAWTAPGFRRVLANSIAWAAVSADLNRHRADAAAARA
jgi:type 1 glutamine amidotransferase